MTCDIDAVDLFAGSGGVSLGLELIGLRDLGFELADEECATRAAARFLTVQGDLSRISRPREFAGIEGLWDSSPCPDFSVAGKRAGRAGKSGWLVDEKMRWITAVNPRWVACENVPTVEPIFREQALELQAMGYRTWVGVLGSEEYGVPQTRDRAYLMAHRDHDVNPPRPTHQEYVFGVPAQEVTSMFGTLRPWVSMAEALGMGTLCSCQNAPRRGRAAGRTGTATTEPPTVTESDDTPTASLTSRPRDPSRADSSSTTSVETDGASTSSTSRRSHSERTSSGAPGLPPGTPPRPTAPEDTHTSSDPTASDDAPSVIASEQLHAESAEKESAPENEPTAHRDTNTPQRTRSSPLRGTGDGRRAPAARAGGSAPVRTRHASEPRSCDQCGGWVVPPSVGFQRLDDTGESESGYRDRDRDLRPTTDPAFNLTEKARSWTLNTGRDWKPGGTRDDAQKRPLTEPAPAPAPALSAIAGPQWLLQPGKQGRAGDPTHIGNRRLYEPDEPAPTIAFGHDSAQWCWVRPATTIAGDPRVFQPGGHHEPGEQSENAIKLEPWEALLLMGMPMNHPLQGSRTAQFRQIGNGCTPPVVSAIVGELTGRDWRSALDEVRGGR